jgi:hypothetical protein
MSDGSEADTTVSVLVDSDEGDPKIDGSGDEIVAWVIIDSVIDYDLFVFPYVTDTVVVVDLF